MKRPADNPFRVSAMESLAFRCDGTTPDHLWVKLESMNHRGAIVGPHGSGKTTLTEELIERYKRAGHPIGRLHVSTNRRRPTPIEWANFIGNREPNRMLFADGTDLLTWRFRRAVVTAGRETHGLIITAHRSGLLPTLIHTRTSPALLRELIQELCPGGATNIWPIAQELYRTRRGNIREVFRELYDRWMLSGSDDGVTLH